MAVIQAQVLQFLGEIDLYRWDHILNGDTCDVVSVVAGQDQMTVQCYGTIGGATLTIAGTIAGTTFQTLDDAFGQALSFAALTTATKPVGPNVSGIRPVLTGGAGSDVSVDLLVVRKTRP